MNLELLSIDQDQRKTLNIRYPKENCWFDRPMPDFSSYLESVRRHYEQWWSLYTLTDAEGRAKAKTQGTLFDFGLIVQTIAPEGDRMEEVRSQTETIERFGVLDGLRKYAGEHVLLVGRPGSGKSTALARLLLEESEKGDRIPVLVELRYWNEQGVLGLIQGFLRSLPTQVGLSPVEIDRTTLEGLLRSNRFLLLMDGLNELPSEEARRDVLRFRREFSRVAIVFTTRDLSLGGDFGIEKKLEMQPLTETQMKAFVTAYVPEQSEAMLRQLGGRLREFGSIPLLLWMLCGLFRQTGEIPANLGGVFRAFTTGYERSLKADVVAEGDRRWWAGLLQALAARMMIGDGSVEFRVAIDRADVVAIFTEFLRDRESLAAGAARKGLEDLLRHHLIQANGSQVEFRHQLIQEYYAAEWLLMRVGGLDDATLQQEFLNYLKWTEPVALMLALVEDEAIAVRVVELALDVDLMLGARLAGEVRSDFQERTVGRITKLEAPKLLKVILLVKTLSQSVTVKRELQEALFDQDPKVRSIARSSMSELRMPTIINYPTEVEHKEYEALAGNAVETLIKLDEETATKELLRMLECRDHKKYNLFYVRHLRHRAAETLGKLASEAALTGLLDALHYQDDNEVCEYAIAGLENIGGEITRVALLNIFTGLTRSNFHLLYPAARALAKIDHESAIIELLIVSENQYGLLCTDSATRFLHATICAAAVGALRQIVKDYAVEIEEPLKVLLIEVLLKMLSHHNRFLRESTVDALVMISDDDHIVTALSRILRQSNTLSYKQYFALQGAAEALAAIGNSRAISELLKALKDKDPCVRKSVAEVLGKISNEIVIVGLLEVFEDEDPRVRKTIAIALGKIGNKEAVFGLLKTLEDKDSDVRRCAAWALGSIGDSDAILGLLKTTKDQDSRIGSIAIEALGRIGSSSVIPDLLEELENQHSHIRQSAAKALGEIGNASVIEKLFNVLNDQDSIVRWSAAVSLEKIGSPLSISRFWQICLQGRINFISDLGGINLLHSITTIQSNCKFYNYEIEQQAKLRKAVQPSYLEENRTYLEGGEGKTIINQFPNATEVKIFENVQTYHESLPRDPPN